ncbi:MAG: hypothetical protein P9M06_05925 [Candidatus Saelkia tenebricola]|nr:hypothetical protein [Candidatus Saelkia tenebricola]
MKRKQFIEGKIELNLKDVQKKEIKLFTSGIRVIVETANKIGICPNCKTPTDKVYEHRKQIILDRPRSDKKVEIEINKKRFLCVNDSCVVKTFTEQIEGLAASKRYTQEFENFLKDLVARNGYIAAQNILEEKYSLYLSLTMLFYLGCQD